MTNKFQLFDITQADSPIGEADSLDKQCEDLEYGDVAEGNYLVLDKINQTKYMLVADRVVSQKDYYSVPVTSSGVIWRPVLSEVNSQAD